MLESKIKIDEVDGLIGSIKTNEKAVDISVSSVKEPAKSRGIMVSEYVKRIKDISKLLDRYKQLLDKDIIDIRISKEKILEMDAQMGNLFETNVIHKH